MHPHALLEFGNLQVLLLLGTFMASYFGLDLFREEDRFSEPWNQNLVQLTRQMGGFMGLIIITSFSAWGFESVGKGILDQRNGKVHGWEWNTRLDIRAGIHPAPVGILGAGYCRGMQWQSSGNSPNFDLEEPHSYP